jgi:hypothetical protein
MQWDDEKGLFTLMPLHFIFSYVNPHDAKNTHNRPYVDFALSSTQQQQIGLLGS